MVKLLESREERTSTASIQTKNEEEEVKCGDYCPVFTGFLKCRSWCRLAVKLGLEFWNGDYLVDILFLSIELTHTVK